MHLHLHHTAAFERTQAWNQHTTENKPGLQMGTISTTATVLLVDMKCAPAHIRLTYM